MRAAVSDLIPVRVGIFNERFLSGTKSDGGEESQSLVSIPKVRELNPKSLRSACDMKAYALLIAICPSDVRPSGPIDAFRKEEASTRITHHPSLPPIHHIYTLHHSTSLRNTVILDTLSNLLLYIALHCGPPKWCRN